jgi:glutathione S-transferase
VVPVRDEISARVDSRLDSVAAFLADKDYLEGSFSAADLLMTTVLRVLRDTDRVASRPVLAAYQRRCESRPAFTKALADQLAAFTRNAPAAG